MTNIQTKQYLKDKALLESFDKIYKTIHMNSYLGDIIDDCLKYDLSTYTMRGKSEFDLAYNNYVKGKSPLEIANIIKNTRG